MSLAAVIRRSAYTIMLLVLTALTVGWKLVGTEPATWISIGFGVAGFVVAVAAWLTPHWRREAGTLRHVIVALAGVVCGALAVLGIL